jgi:hypothetical protein
VRRTAADRRVLDAVKYARMLIPDYARGAHRVTRAEVGELCAYNRIRIHRVAMRTPAILTPPFGGAHRLFLATWLHTGAELYVQLHENGHVICGDADEPTVLHFDGPLPEAEEVADLFALSGIVTASECAEGPAYVEQRIRELAPLEDRGWQVYRVPALAPKLIRMKRLIDEWL